MDSIWEQLSARRPPGSVDLAAADAMLREYQANGYLHRTLRSSRSLC